MKKLILILMAVFCVLTTRTSAQNLDTSKLNKIPLDTLTRTLKYADSSKSNFSNKIDFKTDSIVSHFNKSVDSLRNRQQSDSAYTKRLDSLYKNLQRQLDALRSRYNEAGNAVERKISRLDSAIAQRTSRLDSLLKSHSIQTTRLRLDNVTTDIPNLPSDGIPTALPKVNASEAIPINNLAIRSPELNQVLPNEFTSTITNQDLTSVTTRAGTMVKNVDSLSTADVTNRASKEIEKQATNIDEVKQLKEELNKTAVVKQEFEKTKALDGDPDELKKKAAGMAGDYFSGKEDLIRKDLDNIAKLQKKYPSVKDVRFLPKRRPNEMKGKPFVERLIPAITFQVLPSSDITFDLAPSIGYRISGKINIGAGAFRRISYLRKEGTLTALDCYGFRVNNTFRFFKSVNTYLEYERSKSIDQSQLVHGAILTTPENKWSNKINVGVFNRYSLGRNLFGHFVIMYDILQIKKFPNTTGSSARFGFDYQLVRKRKKHK
jgi:hypothetical protein